MFQRLILANQYEMLARLDPDQSQEHEDAAARIRKWWQLDDLSDVEWMSSARQDPLLLDDQRFVRDVLMLYRLLRLELTPEQRARLITLLERIIDHPRVSDALRMKAERHLRKAKAIQRAVVASKTAVQS
jgi:uncharacterized protein YfbU (UPF0304 family)